MFLHHRFLAKGASMKLFKFFLFAACLMGLTSNTNALTTTKQRSNGESANAGFFNDDGCVQTQGDVGYTHRITTTTNSEGQSFVSETRDLSVFVYQANFCENRILMFGSAFVFVPDGSVPIIDKQLNGTRIALTVPVFNQINSTMVDVEIDVSLTARTEPSTSSRIDVVVMPGQRIKERTEETVRDANISGTIFDGTTHYALAPSGNGVLASFADRYAIK
jgi:hypothetical protein